MEVSLWKLSGSRAWFSRLLLLTGISIAAFSAVRPMVSYRALELGADALQLGIVTSAYAVLALVAAIPIGRWVDQIGEPRFLFAGGLLLALSSFGMIAADSLVLVGTSHAVLGLGHVLLMVAGQTLIANRSDPMQRQHDYGIYGAVSSIGQGIGPAVGGLIAGDAVLPGSTESGGLANVFLLSTVPWIAAALLALAISRSPRGPSAVKGSQLPIWSRVQMSASQSVGIVRMPGMPRVMGASIAVVLSLDLLTAYLPAYGVANGLSAAEVGILLSTRAAFSLLSRLFLGLMLRTLGPMRLLVGTLFLAAVGLAVLPFIDSLVPALFTMAVVGFGLGTGQPMTIAMVANLAPQARRGESIGLRITGNRIAQLTVPWIVGFAAAATGLGTVFWCLTLALGSAGVAFLRGNQEREGDGPSPWG